MQKQYASNWTTDQAEAGPPSRTGVIGLRETLALISRQRNFISVFVLVCTFLLALTVFSMRDSYVADAALVLERNDARLLETVTELESEERDRSAIETEMDIITSRVFAGRVVDALNLTAHPWFNTYLPDDAAKTQTTWLERATDSLKSGWNWVFDEETVRPEPKMPALAAQRDRAISSLLANMDVTRNGDSFAVTVRVKTPDPELSAMLANTITSVYVDWSRDLRKQTMGEAVNFLRERATQIASRIASNEREITDFSRVNDLSSDQRDDLVRKRIEEMNTQLTAARVELAGVRASREQAKRVIGGQAEIEGTALQSPLLSTLRSEQALLVRQRAQFASNYAAGHPQILETDAQLTSVSSMIDGEIKRIVDDLSGEEKVVKDRVAQLETQIEDLQSNVRHRSLAEIRLRELERDLLADQKLHDLVVARLGGLDPFAEIAKPSARVVSVAEIPTAPAFPQRGRILIAGMIGSLVLAIILALMFEAGDTRLRSGQRVEQLVRLPNLASIPGGASSWLLRPMHVLRHLMARPFSRNAEAFRALYLACRAQTAFNKTVLVVTAPLPRDGASSVSLGLAYSAAQDGVRTLYIDLDLQPVASVDDVQEAQSSDTGRSLEISRSLMDGIRTVPNFEKLDILTSAVFREMRKAGAPIGSNEMRLFLEKLRSSYGLIVIDTGPVLIVEDANWLSPFVDAVLLVVRFGRTTEQELVNAVTRLKLNHAPLIGAVLNNVDPRGRARQEPLGAVSYPRLARGYFVE